MQNSNMEISIAGFSCCPHTTEIFITLLNLVSYNVPLLIILFSPDNQFFRIIEEAEWAVEVIKATGKPVGITMCIGPSGDKNSVPPGDCAVRLARAGILLLRCL